jgi:hypothetical protein
MRADVITPRELLLREFLPNVGVLQQDFYGTTNDYFVGQLDSPLLRRDL